MNNMEAEQKSFNDEEFNNLKKNQSQAPNYGPKIGKRHIQVLLVFLLAIMNFIIRSSMSVIIVAMTDPTTSINKEIPTYNWTDKSLIMTAFLWGYMLPQVGAGYLATVFGARWFLAGSVFFSSATTLFLPLVAATLGSKGVIGLRIIQGFTQSFMFPSMHAFLGKWVPLQERSRLGAFSHNGGSVGIIISMLLTGTIASGWYGWPMALYIYGGAGMVVGVLFCYFSASEPDLHTTITEEEKSYIKNNMSENGSNGGEKIFTSRPFWALIVAQIGYAWGNWTLLFETPIYINYVMKFDLKSNSLLCSLPYIAETFSTMFYSFIADSLIVRKIFTVGRTRKIMNTWGLFMQAFLLLLLARCTSEDAYKAIVYLVLIGCTTTSTRSGYNVNQIDLSPNFAGILMGVSNGLSAAVGSLGPLVVYLLVKDEHDHRQWQFVFYISGAISVLCLIFNVIFGSGSVQAWNAGRKNYREKYQMVPLTIQN